MLWKDKLRSMTDGELADFLEKFSYSFIEAQWCGNYCPQREINNSSCACTQSRCQYTDSEILKNWLDCETENA